MLSQSALCRGLQPLLTSPPHPNSPDLLYSNYPPDALGLSLLSSSRLPHPSTHLFSLPSSSLQSPWPSAHSAVPSAPHYLTIYISSFVPCQIVVFVTVCVVAWLCSFCIWFSFLFNYTGILYAAWFWPSTLYVDIGFCLLPFGYLCLFVGLRSRFWLLPASCSCKPGTLGYH